MNANSNKMENNTNCDSACECVEWWKKILQELNSFKIFLQEEAETNPSVIREILSILRDGHETIERQIEDIVKDICDRCDRYHHTWSCTTDDGEPVYSNAGCDGNSHHNLSDCEDPTP